MALVFPRYLTGETVEEITTIMAKKMGITDKTQLVRLELALAQTLPVVETTILREICNDQSVIDALIEEAPSPHEMSTKDKDAHRRMLRAALGLGEDGGE